MTERQPACLLRIGFPLMAVTAAIALGACGSSDTTGTQNAAGKLCSASTVTLSAASTAIVGCDSATVVNVAGGGASYIVIPQFATGSNNGAVTNTPTSYTISVNSGGSLSGARYPQTPAVSPAYMRGANAGGDGSSGARGQVPGIPQMLFDAKLRARARQFVRQRAPRFNTAPSFAVNCCPPAGSIRHFHVLSSEGSAGDKFKAVDASLSYVGSNVLLYIDTAAPKPTFSPSQLQSFGQLFDQTLYPLDSIFGAPSDIDDNGHVIMLLSPVVNALTPSSQCGNGFVGGFFFGFDLVSTDTSSNQGEIFYSIVPDSAGTVSCAHSVASLESTVPDVFLHELQHLINFGQHVLVTGGNAEEGWLDEGESIVAEEQGSIYYEKKFPPPTGRSDPTQLFPDSSQAFINNLLEQFYFYLQRPDTASVTLHSDADNGLAWRGGDWLLLRYLGDQYGNAYYSKLEHDVETGTANLSFAAGGVPFQTLFGDFGVALYADSLPGQPRTTVPATTRFITRNIRQLTNRLFVTGGGQAPFTKSFPLPTTQLTSTPITTSMVPGTSVYYRLDTSSQGTVQITFSGTGGVSLPSTLFPQLTIFRLPPGS